MKFWRGGNYDILIRSLLFHQAFRARIGLRLPDFFYMATGIHKKPTGNDDFWILFTSETKISNWHESGGRSLFEGMCGGYSERNTVIGLRDALAGFMPDFYIPGRP